MSQHIEVIDMFCGAGGTSTGFLQAAAELGLNVKLQAVNHWMTAIASHRQNHPGVRHRCAGIDFLKPRDVLPQGRLNILIASPACTHFSVARGGKPSEEQYRSEAGELIEWMRDLDVELLLLENVKEFEGWGPLNKKGRPIQSRKGEFFRKFVADLRGLGYEVEWRILNSADYGAATIRRRLFLQARKDGKPFRWPKKTHNKAGTNGLRQWRPAREIIDFSIPSQSIFDRKRPLAKNTLARIEAGIEKFWGEWAEPFLVLLRGGGWARMARDLDQPLPTISAQGQHFGLVQPEPFVLPHRHAGFNKTQQVRSSQQPLPTITGNSADLSIIQPFIAQVNHSTPDGQLDHRLHDLDAPLPTVTKKNGFGVIEPFMLTMEHSKAPRHHVRGLDVPVNTITSADAHGLVEPFVVQYYGQGMPRSTQRPLDTVTTRDRFALISGSERVPMDILFRMLTPAELAAANGFPNGYFFAGTRADAVKQIGNAVEVKQARALGLAMLEEFVA